MQGGSWTLRPYLRKGSRKGQGSSVTSPTDHSQWCFSPGEPSVCMRVWGGRLLGIVDFVWLCLGTARGPCGNRLGVHVWGATWDRKLVFGEWALGLCGNSPRDSVQGMGSGIVFKSLPQGPCKESLAPKTMFGEWARQLFSLSLLKHPSFLCMCWGGGLCFLERPWDLCGTGPR